MTPRQLPLDLGYRPALARRDFLVSDTNRAAFDAACDPALGGAGRLVLTGPEGAGKTHLAAIWAAAAEAGVAAAEDLSDAAVRDMADVAAVVIEDADRVAGQTAAEHLLFHALNLTAAHGVRVLLTARTPPARWGVRTPDLASRLAALPHVAIGPPDDSLLSKILDKLFSDRQLSASPDAVRFLVPRMERSFARAVRIVAALDSLALATRRPITRNLAMDLYDADPEAITGTGED